MNIKESCMYVDILGSFDYEGKSPSVDKVFKKGKYTDYLENFKQDCKDLAESQNGYYSTETMSDGSYKTTFYTSDDVVDDLYGRVTGCVIWSVNVSFEREIVNFMDY